MFFNATTIAILALVIFISLVRFLTTRKKNNLPPGPPRLPIIGNLHQAPEHNPWRKYQEWSKQYGPIFSLQYGLNTIIMLGTHEAAHDLLDKRSNIYSSRPRVVMGGECVSKGYRSLLMPYGQRWRSHQRLQGAFLNVRISQNYRNLQELESLQLIYELFNSEADFADRYHRYSSSLIFALAYGRRMVRGDEREVKGIDQVMENFLYAARVGTWLVDALPALNYLPKFLAPWRRLGDKLHAFESKLYMDNLSQGQHSNSWNWSKQAQEMKEGQTMSEKELAYDVGILRYEKGQAELDAVLGPVHFPSFEDKDKLPYIEAIVRETLRWRPVSAGGIPHAVIQDDKYMGYHIPAGATVIGNHWAIHLDENVYNHPYSFDPERWIEQPNLPLAAFGFGRRVCTGQHIAKNSLFINIARILWSFDINYKYKLVDGKKLRCEVDPLGFTQGFNSRPVRFEASFVPRGGRESVVKQIWEAAEKDLDVVMGRLPLENAGSGLS